jgi:hypothetical protein
MSEKINGLPRIPAPRLADAETVKGNVQRYRCKAGKPLAYVRDYVTTKRNPNAGKFGNIDEEVSFALEQGAITGK